MFYMAILRTLTFQCQNCVAYCPRNGTYTTFLERTYLSILWVHLAYFWNDFQSTLIACFWCVYSECDACEWILPKNRITQAEISSAIIGILTFKSNSSWCCIYNSATLSSGGVHIDAIKSGKSECRSAASTNLNKWYSRCSVTCLQRSLWLGVIQSRGFERHKIQHLMVVWYRAKLRSTSKTKLS